MNKKAPNLENSERCGPGNYPQSTHLDFSLHNAHNVPIYCPRAVSAQGQTALSWGCRSPQNAAAKATDENGNSESVAANARISLASTETRHDDHRNH